MPVTNYFSVNGQLIGEQPVGSPAARLDYLIDALGSVTGTVDQSAQVVNTYRYKPYGTQLAKTGMGTDPAFQWVGSWGYRKTGRSYSDVYVRARHYSSGLGRWITMDPIGYIEGTNRYCYTRGNSVVALDPSGTRFCNLNDVPTVQPCPKRCQLGHEQDPVLPKPAPCPKAVDFATIETLCKLDRKLFDEDKDTMSGDLPPEWFVATTFCCYDESCDKNYPLTQYPVVGCTVWFEEGGKKKNEGLPHPYQKCIIEHERRRRWCCKNSCSESLSGKDDHYLTLLCVWDELKRCYPNQIPTLRRVMGSCEPPEHKTGIICGRSPVRD